MADGQSQVTLKKPGLFSFLAPGAVKIGNAVGHAVDRVEREQILPNDWKTHVDPFRGPSTDNVAWTGEFWGKMVRGACLIYDYTQNREIYHSVEETVRDFLTTQDEEGRFSTYDLEHEFGGWDTWGRKYVLLGLLSFYRVCKDLAFKERVRTAMTRHADYILSKIGPASEGKLPITLAAGDWKGLPAVSILEPMAQLYEVTGFPRYLDFCTYIVEEGGMSEGHNIFEMARQGVLFPYQYFKDWSKAYEMTSCFEGLEEYATVAEDKKWGSAALNYYEKVRDGELAVTGSGGSNGGVNVRGAAGEQWNNTRYIQTDPTIKFMQETCVTVTWLRYCSRILLRTGDPKVMDEIEKTLYNALLAAMRPEEIVPGTKGPASRYLFSYFTLMTGIRGVNGGGDIPWINSCCAANGPSAVGLLPFLAVMESEEGPVVNLYLPGEFHGKTPAGGRFLLQIQTDYPETEKVDISVRPESEEVFKLRVRIPAWSGQADLCINGEAVPAQRGTYAEIRRKWRKGETVRLTLDLRTKMLDSFDGSLSTSI